MKDRKIGIRVMILPVNEFACIRIRQNHLGAKSLLSVLHSDNLLRFL